MGFLQVLSHLLLVLQFAPVTVDPGCGTVATAPCPFITPLWQSVSAQFVAPDGSFVGLFAADDYLAFAQPIQDLPPSRCVETSPPPPTPSHSPRQSRTEYEPSQPTHLPHREVVAGHAPIGVVFDNNTSASLGGVLAAGAHWLHLMCSHWVSAKILARGKLNRVLEARASRRMIADAMGRLSGATFSIRSGLRVFLADLEGACHRILRGASAVLSAFPRIVSLLVSTVQLASHWTAHRVATMLAAQYQFLSFVVGIVPRFIGVTASVLELAVVISGCFLLGSLSMVLTKGATNCDSGYLGRQEAGRAFSPDSCEVIVQLRQQLSLLKEHLRKAEEARLAAVAEARQMDGQLEKVHRLNKELCKERNTARAELQFSSARLETVRGAKDGLSNQNRQRRNEITKLRQNEAKLRDEIDKLQEELKSLATTRQETSACPETALTHESRQGPTKEQLEHLGKVEADLLTQRETSSQLEVQLRDCKGWLSEQGNKLSLSEEEKSRATQLAEALQGQLQDAQREVLNLKTLNQDLTSSIERLQSENASVADLNAKIDDLEIDMFLLESKNLELKSKNDSLSEPAKDKPQEQISQLKSANETLQSTLSSLQGQNQALNENAESSQREKLELQNQLSEAGALIESQQAQIRSRDAQISTSANDVQRQIEQRDKEIARLNELVGLQDMKLAIQEKQRQQLQVQMENLPKPADIQKLRNELADLKETYNSHTGYQIRQIEQLTGEVQKLTMEKKKLTNKAKELELDAADAKQRADTAEQGEQMLHDMMDRTEATLDSTNESLEEAQRLLKESQNDLMEAQEMVIRKDKYLKLANEQKNKLAKDLQKALNDLGQLRQATQGNEDAPQEAEKIVED